MRALLLAALLVAAFAAAPAAAQTVVTSPRPENVAVTVYREPNRSPSRGLDPEWLNGYALISETRTISIPAGEIEIRFEGVAGGIIPQSAIVSGLPEGIVERNHDAYLLSPASLLDRSLGRRVHIRRTSTATGRVVEQEAVIRSGADGAVVLQTEAGIEALRCTGHNETILYPGVPSGLAARPTLSVRARSSRAATATITLSYLATGFDWEANYVVHLAPSGDRADLFAWLTLASNDETSFVDAETQAVAGRLNREEDEDLREREPPPAELSLRCWPAGRTGDVSAVVDEEFSLSAAANVEQVIDGLPQVLPPSEEAISVTGSRIVRQEELGDLKLYRLPERVTVASNSQKQVAMIRQPDVRVEIVYRQRRHVGDEDGPEGSVATLVTRNRSDEGLGLPLPAGRVVLFAAGAGRPLLLGEGFVRDRAVGEDVEIGLEPATEDAPTPMTEIELVREGKDWAEFAIVATNDRPYPVRLELELEVDEGERLRPERRLGRRNGRPLWAVTVPANGEARLRYRVHRREGEDRAARAEEND